jgi:CBS domain-containing protein
MQVADWMTRHPVAVRASSTVREARRLLSYHRVRHLPVVDGDRVVGMLHDADVRIDEVRLEDDEPTGPLYVHDVLGSDRSVASVLHGPVHLVPADAAVETAAELLIAHRVSCLPVVDRDRRLVGVITTGDCLRALLTGQPIVG